MKRYIFSVLLALTFVFTGLQAVFLPADAVAFRGNAASREALPAELKGLDVQDDFIDSGAQQAGFLQTVIGHVVVLHEESGEAFFAAAGDAVSQHDVIFTLSDSRCRVKFTTEDLITMGENAKLGLEEYIDNRPRKRKKSIFNMLRGKAMFYAVRLFKYRTTSTTVNTPTAVVCVLGTKFALEVRKAGEKIAESDPIYLADASDSGLKYLLGKNDTGETVTIARCLAGIIGVKGATETEDKTQLVYTGQASVVTPAGVVETYTMPQQEIDQTNADTHVPDSEAKDDGTGEAADDGTGEAADDGTGEAADDGTGESVVDTGGDAGTTVTDLADKAVDQTSTNTVVQIAEESAARPTVHKGYFTGMLTDQPCEPCLDNVYVSQTRQDLDSQVVTAIGLYEDISKDFDPFIDANSGSGFDDPTLKQVSYDGTILKTSADNLNLAITHGELGFNSYQEWGWWYVEETFIINVSIVHDLWHKGYYISGEPTPDAAVAGISGTYSGNSWGTYWDGTVSAPGGIDMTGTFSCTVNSSSISNFNLRVDGGTKYAEIINGSGTISNGEFAITGTFDLNGDSPPAVDGVAFGSLYGPNGEYIGGAWGMKEDDLNGAQGVFQGAKQ